MKTRISDSRLKNSPKILLGHLATNGDCLYATAVARQIKHDFPGCHLTWAVGSLYRQAIENNPFVDAIWEFPIANREEVEGAWRTFVREAKQRQGSGEFDMVFFTQVAPDNYQNFDGTLRSSIFRGYGRPMTVPVTPSMRLTQEEIEHVRQFAALHQIQKKENVILFECAAYSSQSFVSPEFAMEVAHFVLEKSPNCLFILSSNKKIESSDSRITDGSVLGFRENAELTKFCSLLVGGSSGVSWLATSDWAKPLPTIQLLRKEMGAYASMCHDHEYFDLPTGHIIEMTECVPQHVADCILATLSQPFSAVRERFHERIEVDLRFYMERFMRSQLRQFHPLKIIQSMWLVYKRYGARPYINYLRTKINLEFQ